MNPRVSLQKNYRLRGITTRCAVPEPSFWRKPSGALGHPERSLSRAPRQTQPKDLHLELGLMQQTPIHHTKPRYHRRMTPLTPSPRLKPIWRAIIEVVFIIFLFYSNLLMGEFTGVNGQGKSLAFALRDVMTPANILIAIVSASIGYVIFEYLRKKL
jgi:hypothetical protein